MFDKLIDMALVLVVLCTGTFLMETTARGKLPCVRVTTFGCTGTFLMETTARAPVVCNNGCRPRTSHCYIDGTATKCWEWKYVDCYYCVGLDDVCQDAKDGSLKGCQTGTSNPQQRRIWKQCGNTCAASAGYWEGTSMGKIDSDWADAGTNQHLCTK